MRLAVNASHITSSDKIMDVWDAFGATTKTIVLKVVIEM
jgi:hypothetical protein